MEKISSDPELVSFSTVVYRALLNFYPTRFRQEYGAHMAQVFRDCCLKTYQQSGPPGMIGLWALTLFDWVKTVIEEQMNRGTNMTQQKFIRLSGWGMVLGATTLTLAFLVASGPILREWMIRFLGISDSSEGFKLYRAVKDSMNNASGWLGFAAMFLLLVGIVGLRLQYGNLVGRFGRTSLLLSIVSGGIAALGSIGSSSTFLDGIFTLGNYGLYIFIVELSFRMSWYGAIALFAFLALFGVAALRTKPMSRWNGLPLLSGVGTSWILLGLGPVSLGMGLTLVALASFFLLGYVLQGDALQDKEILSLQA